MHATFVICGFAAACVRGSLLELDAPHSSRSLTLLALACCCCQRSAGSSATDTRWAPEIASIMLTVTARS